MTLIWSDPVRATATAFGWDNGDSIAVVDYANMIVPAGEGYWSYSGGSSGTKYGDAWHMFNITATEPRGGWESVTRLKIEAYAKNTLGNGEGDSLWFRPRVNNVAINDDQGLGFIQNTGSYQWHVSDYAMSAMDITAADLAVIFSGDADSGWTVYPSMSLRSDARSLYVSDLRVSFQYEYTPSGKALLLGHL